MFVNKLSDTTLHFNSASDNKLDALESDVLSIYNTLDSLITSHSNEFPTETIQKYIENLHSLKKKRSGLVIPIHLLEVLEGTDKVDEYLETLQVEYKERVESKKKSKALLKKGRSKCDI